MRTLQVDARAPQTESVRRGFGAAHAHLRAASQKHNPSLTRSASVGARHVRNWGIQTRTHVLDVACSCKDKEFVRLADKWLLPRRLVDLRV